MPAATGLAETK